MKLLFILSIVILANLSATPQSLRAKNVACGINKVFYLEDNYTIKWYGKYPYGFITYTNSTSIDKSSCISDEKGELQFVCLQDNYVFYDSIPYIDSSTPPIEDNYFHSSDIISVHRPGESDIYDVFITHADTSTNVFYTSVGNDTEFNGFQWNALKLRPGQKGEIIHNERIIRPNGASRVGITQHANQKDFWVIFHGVGDNVFRVFPLSNKGLEIDKEQIFSIGLSAYEDDDPVDANLPSLLQSDFNLHLDYYVEDSGKMIISSNGNIIVRMADYQTIEMFRFDKEMGKVYCPTRISPSFKQREYLCDIALSPNGRYLYALSISLKTGSYSNVVSSQDIDGLFEKYLLHQYDLFAEDIAKSKTLISEFPTYKSSLWSHINGKIYYTLSGNHSTSVYTRFEGIDQYVIDSPNLPGTACNLRPITYNRMPGSIFYGIGYINTMVASYLPDETEPNYPFGKPIVEYPNAFSPNGDGKNEKFLPKHIQGVSYGEIRIYNVWGKEVYSSNNLLDGWDGGNLPAGKYYYSLSYQGKGCDEGTHNSKGWVQLFK